MNDFICGNFIRDIENSTFDSKSYLALLCGSSLIECNPRDTDIFIYTTEDEQNFCKNLVNYLSNIDKKVKYCYLASLKFYSVKYTSNDISYSLHVVSKNRLFDIIQKASLVETYTDINVFDVKLYNQTAYRKWIIETEYLIGNISLKEELAAELLRKKVPFYSAKNELIARLKNNINYFNEKVTDDIVLCNLVAGQIINNLINYLYLVNGIYYGTLKYIKSDLEGFMCEKELSKLTICIIKSINVKEIKDISALINKIINLIN